METWSDPVSGDDGDGDTGHLHAKEGEDREGDHDDEFSVLSCVGGRFKCVRHYYDFSNRIVALLNIKIRIL